jgi:hypothetical protein
MKLDLFCFYYEIRLVLFFVSIMKSDLLFFVVEWFECI